MRNYATRTSADILICNGFGKWSVVGDSGVTIVCYEEEC